MDRIGHKHNFNSGDFAGQDRAATSLERVWRGYVARKGCLSNPSYATYKPLCKAVSEGLEMPKASSGRTQVFFPPTASSIILKQSGRQDAIQRFSDMQSVREILRSQKSSHLVVPKAALCENFLVEERLPISSDRYVNMQCYIDHPQAFDEAAREMVRLFSKAHLTDLVSSIMHPISNIVGNTIRYDNIPLYIENGVGKIGLIDLENLSYEPNSQSSSETLARIFPYHVDMIIEESKSLNMTFNESLVRYEAKQGHTFLQKGYIDHLNWLRQKEIAPFEVTTDRLNIVIENLTKKLLKKNLSWLTEELIDKSVRNIVSNLEKVLLDTETATVNTDADLISFRSPAFKRGRLEQNVLDKDGIIDDLIEGTCNELVKGGELFSYDPNYSSGRHQLCWIRY